MKAQWGQIKTPVYYGEKSFLLKNCLFIVSEKGFKALRRYRFE